ncbi:hypothetical protein HZA75_06805 [Candidatus Roizmanbacteria bacterium]|nr:hypothetical protein [Candidatus Roizmanbacteria bacterium]
MNKKIFKFLTIALLITAASFILLGFPHIKNFGITSLVEETPVNFDKATYFNKAILKGQKIIARFQSSENNLGVVQVRFVKFGEGRDTLVFRLKKEGEKNWYYENKYSGVNFQNGKYFPFGFPRLINSKNGSYIFELESVAGTDENGIGISYIEPQTSFVYNYSVREFSKPSIFSKFIAKKILYVSQYINYIQLVSIVVLSMLLFYFRKEIKGIKKNFRRNPKKAYQRLVKTITTTKLYQIFLNTDFKKKLVIGLLIFISAFLYRFAALFTNQQNLFYATLGGQGDYDQFMRASTCAWNFCSWILHQNLLIESLILGSFYHFFGFIGGIKLYVYLMLIISAIVATLPYFLLSRKNWFSIGGIIGSLLLTNSDFLTITALNYPPDNGSLFIFSMFYLVYLLTMHDRTIRWLFIFGLIGFFDGMFKAMFLINDLAVLALFVPVFFYEKAKKVALPLGKQLRLILKQKNIKILLLSLLPLLVFLTLYSAWEYFVQIKYSAPYFLRGLVDSGGSDFRFETLFFNRSSGRAESDLIIQLFYLIISGLVMIKRIISLLDLQVIFFVPVFLGLLLYSKSKIKYSSVMFRTIILFSLIIIVLLICIRNNYLGIHQYFLGEYIYKNWTLETYVNIFLFVEIIFLFILYFKYKAFKLVLPILPYVTMLIVLSRNAPWLRLLIHPIVWIIILFAFLIDSILSNAKKTSVLKRFYFGYIFLILFILFYTLPKQVIMVENLYSGISNYKNEVKYLRWVNSSLPSNAIILAGGESDLVTVGENINRPIIYNSLWATSLLIRPNTIPGVTPDDFNIIKELKNQNNFKKNKYIILKNDLPLWQHRVGGVQDNLFSTSSANFINPANYKVELYRTNKEMNVFIFELRLR